MASRSILVLAIALAGCLGAPAPLAQPEGPDASAPPSPAPFCGAADWFLDTPPLVAGREARLVLHLTNPCGHRIEVAHSTRQPTLWASDASGNTSIHRDELTRAAFLSLEPGETRDWTYTWAPGVRGPATLKADYPELFREYQALRFRAFPVEVG